MLTPSWPRFSRSMTVSAPSWVFAIDPHPVIIRPSYSSPTRRLPMCSPCGWIANTLCLSTYRPFSGRIPSHEDFVIPQPQLAAPMVTALFDTESVRERAFGCSKDRIEFLLLLPQAGTSELP